MSMGRFGTLICVVSVFLYTAWRMWVGDISGVDGRTICLLCAGWFASQMSLHYTETQLQAKGHTR